MPQPSDYYVTSTRTAPPAPHAGAALSRDQLGPEALAAASTLSLVLLLAAPAGMLWAKLGPGVEVVRTAAGIQLVDPTSKATIGADGWFLVMGLVLGVCCALAAWRLARAPGIGVAVGLAAGCLLAAWLAANVGQLVGVEALERLEARQPVAAGAAPEYSRLSPPCIEQADGSGADCSVKANGVLFAWPVAALLALAGCAAWGRPRYRVATAR